MKAESIEQIREHLSRGGRVLCHFSNGCVSDAVEVVRMVVWIKLGAAICFHDRDVDHWELLPLEEKPTRQYYYRVNGCLAEDSSSETCICWHDEGTGPLNDRPDRVHDWRDKPKEAMPLPGVPASSLPLVTEDPTGESNRFRDSQKERMQRIRKALLFGHVPSMTDLLAWWEATTGEKIEHGRRCNVCECTGSITQICKSGPHQISATTVPCSCDNGYTVRPTWMGERV